MKRFGFALVARLAFAVAYPVVAWLCWVPNLVVAEWLLRMTSGSAPLRPPDGLDPEEGAGLARRTEHGRP